MTKSAKVLDLFCGAGGFSLGFEQAGYDVVAGIDNNEQALATYDANIDARAIRADLSEESPEELLDEHGIDPAEIDVVVGGPPCQAFSIAGDRDPDDPRADLSDRYYDWIDYVNPRVFLMENVPGILTMEDGDVIERLVDTASSYGYNVDYRKLNAADYGVPQLRERVFIQGVRDGSPSFPERTHAPPEEIENQSSLCDYEDE